MTTGRTRRTRDYFPSHFIRKKDIVGRVFLRIWPLQPPRDPLTDRAGGERTRRPTPDPTRRRNARSSEPASTTRAAARGVVAERKARRTDRVGRGRRGRSPDRGPLAQRLCCRRSTSRRSRWIPTLKKNDRVIVNKLSYRLHDVHRGDIVVFTTPPGVNQRRSRISSSAWSRLPGETVQGRDGKVTRQRQGRCPRSTCRPARTHCRLRPDEGAPQNRCG